MSLAILFRRYALPGLLFSLCLGLVLFSEMPAISQPIASNVQQSSAIAVQTSASPSQPSPKLPSDGLTASVHRTVLDNGLTVLTKEVDTAPVVTVRSEERR